MRQRRKRRISLGLPSKLYNVGQLMSALSEQEVPSSREVEDLLQGYRKLVARFRQSDALTRGDVDVAFRQITELASQVLRVERASVWRLTGSGIECVDLYRRTGSSHDRPGAITKTDATPYFAALETERCVVAEDAPNDPRTRVLAPYLAEHGIGAMLDAPVFLHGAMVGVVCHEHVGSARRWAFWEELVAGTMADFVALVMEAEELIRAKAQVAAHREEEGALRAIFDATPTPLILANGEGRIELFNPRAREVIGVPPGTPPGSVHASRFYASLADRDRLLGEVREKGLVDGIEIRMKTWSGEERWVLASVRLVSYRGAPHYIMGTSDISAQKELEARLRDLATRDGLTGLFNRRYLFEVAAKELERAKRYERPLALAMLDADNFKKKNDAYGHLVGDDLLVAFARSAASELRSSDVVARYGGEEIVILYPETALDAAEAVTNRIRQRLGGSPIATAAGPISMTCSGGVVMWNRSESFAELLDRADHALYAAKAGGRDRVVRG